MEKLFLLMAQARDLVLQLQWMLQNEAQKVIMACRSGIPEKGDQVKKISGNNDIHMLHVDFSDINSIRHLASSIQHHFAPIDIFICNSACRFA